MSTSARRDTLGPEGQIGRSWIVFGVTAAIVGDLLYFLTAAPLGLPERLVLVFGLAFGPLLSLGFIGFYRFFTLHKKSVAVQAAAVFGIIAGAIVNMMIVVQAATRAAVPVEARGQLGLAWDGLNMVQLGLDVSWDIYLSAATIFLGVGMWSHPRFGKLWGTLTVAVAAALLVLNLLTFPTPPAAAGSIDLGPVIGVWYLVIAVRVLTSLRWADQRLTVSQISEAKVT